ncbi:glycosyltransferase family 4 protein [Streptomyces sp. NPDC050560]|uniref:glycosyltransferase family 4 protein n=1 Tax=Streptomyces sp. NPDC050560 TaxID=3365630 RepID=UPI00379AE136
MSSHAPHGHASLRAVQVVGGRGAGLVRPLAAGLVARGVRVLVCAPPEAERLHRYTEAGARHLPLPWHRGPVSVAALRAACRDADVVHAHGLQAALRSALALTGRATPLVVTWPPPLVTGTAEPEGSRGRLRRMLERRAARAASVVLGADPDAVATARRRGARDARLAAVALVVARSPHPRRDTDPDDPGGKARAELGAMGRPLLLAVGALRPRQGMDVLLDAARSWRGFDPEPLLVVVGEGPLHGSLQRRIHRERLPVRLLGERDDLPDLLAAADIAIAQGGAAARPVLAHQALHARVPLVAADSGCTAALVGQAAQFFPDGDARALGRAVVRLLADPARREALKDLGAERAATWPTEDETVAQTLSVYDELTGPAPALA